MLLSAHRPLCFLSLNSWRASSRARTRLKFVLHGGSTFHWKPFAGRDQGKRSVQKWSPHYFLSRLEVEPAPVSRPLSARPGAEPVAGEPASCLSCADGGWRGVRDASPASAGASNLRPAGPFDT